jgi:hypothetical protein
MSADRARSLATSELEVAQPVLESCSVTDLLRSVRAKGTVLWLENGQLRYRAPAGALGSDDLSRLRSLRHAIIEVLEAVPAAGLSGPPLEPRSTGDLLPLTYSQYIHWRWHASIGRTHIRQIATATRIRGILHLGALQEALWIVTDRHEALRTRIVSRDGAPCQEIFKNEHRRWEFNDLSRLSTGEQDAAVQQLIDADILAPTDLALSPLVGIRLLKLAQAEYVLLVVMEHLISDGVSANIFLNELCAAYGAIVSGQPIRLAPLRIQLGDFAVWQRRREASWLALHGPYWRSRLEGYGRCRFPDDAPPGGAPRKGWGTVCVEIDQQVRSELVAWSRQQRTTVVMSVFAAYAAAVLRWCQVTEAVIRYQTSGRDRPDVENTIGFFAAALPLRVTLRETDTLRDLGARVMHEYCSASEHADLGCLEAQEPPPEYVKNSAFNWLPEESTPSSSQAQDSALPEWRRMAFRHPMLDGLEKDAEPAILLLETKERITGEIYFPRRRISEQSMRNFASNFLALTKAVVNEPDKCIKEIVLLRPT